MNIHIPARPASIALKSTAALTATAALLLLGSGAASAHVTVSPNKTAEGGFAQATFNVPNESDTASTTKLEVALPATTPFTSVRTKPVDGWTAEIVRGELPEPVQVEGETVTEAATSIVWTADQDHAIGPDEFQTFTISIGALPKAGTDIVLPATQHYSDGRVVAWDEIAAEGQEANRPAPAFTTTAAEGDGHGHATGSAAPTAAATPEAAAAQGGATPPADSPQALGIAGIGLGAAGLLLGGAALARTRGTRRVN